jgi:hypothetical protein
LSFRPLALSWRETNDAITWPDGSSDERKGETMTSSEILRQIHEGVQVSGKFERNEVLAVWHTLIDFADRLEKVERVCEIKHPH